MLRMMYAQQSKEPELSLLAKDILHTLIYFDIFNYPLKLEEIYFNSSIKNVDIDSIHQEILLLVDLGLISNIDEWYFLYNNASIITDRLKGNKKADFYLKLATKIGLFMACFPFVRGVFVSGSLSKGYMNNKSDIDFFIITAPDRLWLSRTLLILFKKLLLLNSRKFFCPNYFIDTNHLKIQEQNMYTAKELSYLIPIYNATLYRELLSTNEWRDMYMPNFIFKSKTAQNERNILKTFLEKILSGKAGEKLDLFFMKFTESFWQRKYRRLYKNDVDIKCSRHVSKFHPNGYQNKVISKFEKNVMRFESFYNISLDLCQTS
jgi:hypothetical protein